MGFLLYSFEQSCIFKGCCIILFSLTGVCVFGWFEGLCNLRSLFFGKGERSLRNDLSRMENGFQFCSAVQESCSLIVDTTS